MAHLPHWMQRSLSQTGMNWAMLRFSYCGRARGECAASRKCADREQVALAAGDLTQNVVDELGSLAGDGADDVEVGGSRCRQLDLFQVRDGGVDGGEVLGHNRFTTLAVGLLDGLLDLLDGFVARQHAADGEEAGLHDGVDARAHAGFAANLVAVDHIELDLLAQHLCWVVLGMWFQTSDAG